MKSFPNFSVAKRCLNEGPELFPGHNVVTRDYTIRKYPLPTVDSATRPQYNRSRF